MVATKAMECLKFYVDYSKAHYRPPTVDEIAAEFNVQKNAAQGYLNSLKRAGYLESRGTNRGTQITAKCRAEFNMDATAQPVTVTGKNGTATIYPVTDGVFAVFAEKQRAFIDAPTIERAMQFVQRKLDKD